MSILIKDGKSKRNLMAFAFLKNTNQSRGVNIHYGNWFLLDSDSLLDHFDSTESGSFSWVISYIEWPTGTAVVAVYPVPFRNRGCWWRDDTSGLM